MVLSRFFLRDILEAVDIVNGHETTHTDYDSDMSATLNFPE